MPATSTRRMSIENPQSTYTREVTNSMKEYLHGVPFVICTTSAAMVIVMMVLRAAKGNDWFKQWMTVLTFNLDVGMGMSIIIRSVLLYITWDAIQILVCYLLLIVAATSTIMKNDRIEGKKNEGGAGN
jgi:hypothetical protein